MPKRKTKKRTRRKLKVKAQIIRNKKKFFLTKFGFTNKPAATKTAQALRKAPGVKEVAIVKKGTAYLIYVRV